jgi:hypothetical protein
MGRDANRLPDLVSPRRSSEVSMTVMAAQLATDEVWATR